MPFVTTILTSSTTGTPTIHQKKKVPNPNTESILLTRHQFYQWNDTRLHVLLYLMNCKLRLDFDSQGYFDVYLRMKLQKNSSLFPAIGVTVLPVATKKYMYS